MRFRGALDRTCRERREPLGLFRRLKQQYTARILGQLFRLLRVPYGLRQTGCEVRQDTDRPVVPEHHLNRQRSRPASGIVFESSTVCLETTRDVANTLAKSAFRYISRRLDTRQPDLGSGAARRGGSSPSSCTEKQMYS